MPASVNDTYFTLIHAEWYIDRIYVAVLTYAETKFAAENEEQLYTIFERTQRYATIKIKF